MLEVVQPVHVVSSDVLRGSVGFTLKISDKSTITQEIVMDAMCPYIKFNTEVHCNQGVTLTDSRIKSKLPTKKIAIFILFSQLNMNRTNHIWINKRAGLIFSCSETASSNDKPVIKKFYCLT